jgi:hypothetical protein
MAGFDIRLVGSFFFIDSESRQLYVYKEKIPKFMKSLRTFFFQTYKPLFTAEKLTREVYS